jgi:hypothetical protein
VGANRIARWDGQSWSALGSGLNGTVRAFEVFDDGNGSGPDLIVGGQFLSSPAGDSHLARFGCQSPLQGFTLTTPESGAAGEAELSVVAGWDGAGIVPRFVLQPENPARQGVLLLSEPGPALSLAGESAALRGTVATPWLVLPLSGAEASSLPAAARRARSGRELQVQALFLDDPAGSLRCSNAVGLHLER